MKLLNKFQELGFFFFFFVLLGSYQACHTLLLLLVQCSSSVKLQWNILDGMKEQFWDYLQDSRIYSVLGRLAASHYKTVLEKLCCFFFCSFRVFLSLWFFFLYMKVADCVSDFDLGDPWMLCEIPTVIKQYLIVDIQMSHVSKEFIQWHTQLKENIVLYRNISLKWTLAAYQESAHVTKTTKRERKGKTKTERG